MEHFVQWEFVIWVLGIWYLGTDNLVICKVKHFDIEAIHIWKLGKQIWITVNT